MECKIGVLFAQGHSLASMTTRIRRCELDVDGKFSRVTYLWLNVVRRNVNRCGLSVQIYMCFTFVGLSGGLGFKSKFRVSWCARL